MNAQKRKAQNLLEEESATAPTLLLKGEIRSATTGAVIQRCFGCIQREKKTLEKKVGPKGFDSENVSLDNERSRTLQVYSEPLVDFSTGESIIYARITCYCRHHKELKGFIMRLALVDESTQQQVAVADSQVIMITDDHKGVPASKKRARDDPGTFTLTFKSHS